MLLYKYGFLLNKMKYFLIKAEKDEKTEKDETAGKSVKDEMVEKGEKDGKE